MAAIPPLLELEDISREFSGVRALSDVDFDLRSGEVHVLMGENGAGKSTLINIIAGSIQPDRGTIRLRGETLPHLTTHRARTLGISPVFQEFSLIPELTVVENLFLGREIHRGPALDNRSMRTKAAEVLDSLGFGLRPTAKVSSLSRAQQQMVEIAKALLQDLTVLILDEPTASLTERETYRLFELIEKLQRDGIGIIYVSHRMAEIRRIGTRMTVLRDGAKICTVDLADVDDGRIVELMTGRKVEAIFPHIASQPAAPVLEVKGITTATKSVVDASLTLHAGEIVGLAGLVGCGKSELGRAIFGLETIAQGDVFLDGSSITHGSPSANLNRGLCYFPSDRVREGLALDRPIRENASITALRTPALSRLGFVLKAAEKKRAFEMAGMLKLRPAAIEPAVGSLSGGNRQKVMLMRGFMRGTRVFIFDEPTIGIDISAKIEIYDLIKQLAEQGAAILLISSEMPEILHLCHRTVVMVSGRATAEWSGGEITERNILGAIFQGDKTAPSIAA